MNKALGQNWILLRGLARESAHWGAFVPLLQSTFPDAHVTLLDLPGTGRFHQETSPRSIKAITDRVRQHAFDHGFHKTTGNGSGAFPGGDGCLGVDAQLPRGYLRRNAHQYQLCRFESLL